MENAKFTMEEMWDFKPFFTLQPIDATRERQLQCWRSIVLTYFSQHMEENRLSLNSFPLFSNPTIGRSLSKEGIKAVADKLVRSGNAEWEDSSRSALRIILKSPETLAVEIYNWAVRNDYIGSVLTIFELYSGEEHCDSEFYGTDPTIVMRALAILEKESKCLVIHGVTKEDSGVKFLPRT